MWGCKVPRAAKSNDPERPRARPAMAAPLASADIVLVKELYLHMPPERDVVPENELAKSA